MYIRGRKQRVNKKSYLLCQDFINLTNADVNINDCAEYGIAGLINKRQFNGNWNWWVEDCDAKHKVVCGILVHG